jgi:hypothetical protein
MKISAHIPHSPRSTRIVMGVGWVLIAVKCAAVSYAVDRWHMPFRPVWIIGPTLVFAALATVLWLTHDED